MALVWGISTPNFSLLKGLHFGKLPVWKFEQITSLLHLIHFFKYLLRAPYGLYTRDMVSRQLYFPELAHQ